MRFKNEYVKPTIIVENHSENREKYIYIVAEANEIAISYLVTWELLNNQFGIKIENIYQFAKSKIEEAVSKDNVQYTLYDFPDGISKLLVCLDQDKNEIIYNQFGKIVMMEWEKAYMEDLVDALSPYGDVLEIGFGLGYSASKIMEYNINSYTIVEPNKNICYLIEKWAEQYSNVDITIINDYDFNFIDKTNKKFDCILFDPFNNDKSFYRTFFEIPKIAKSQFKLSSFFKVDKNCSLDYSYLKKILGSFIDRYECFKFETPKYNIPQQASDYLFENYIPAIFCIGRQKKSKLIWNELTLN